MDSSGNINKLPRYILDHLERIAKNEGFIEYKIDQDAGSNHGEGFMSTLLRITLSGLRNCNGKIKSDTLSLISKLLPDSEARRKQFNSVLIFEREIYFYNTVVPILCDFQQRNGLTRENGGFYSFPKCYGTSFDAAKDEVIIIMEDLRVDGFDLCTKNNRFECENAKLLFMALGRLHGLSFALRDQEPEVFKNLQAYLSKDILLSVMETDAFKSFMAGNLDLAIESLQTHSDIRIAKRIRDTWISTFNEVLLPNVSEPFAVISQGDCWNNNMMFMNDSNNLAKEICILDWQAARLQSPALDLSTFILSTMTKSMRDQYLDQFLQIYYDSLSEIIERCGSVPAKLFSFTDLQEQFRRFGKYGTIFAMPIIQVLMADSADIIDMDAYADEVQKTGESSMNLTNMKPDLQKLYGERISNCIGDAVKYGWITAENIIESDL